MITGISGIIIGVPVLGAGIYYLINDKGENSKKIYGIISATGAAVAAVSVFVLISNIG